MIIFVLRNFLNDCQSMKRFSLFTTVFVALLSIIVACNKNGETHCAFVSPELIFVNYMESDLDTIVVRRFPKDNSFSKPVDTTVFAKGDVTYKLVGDDSTTFKSGRDAYRMFTEELFNNDWEIYLPATGQTSRIYNVVGSFPKSTDPGEACKSFVKSMNFEGVERTYITWIGDDYRYFMVKD